MSFGCTQVKRSLDGQILDEWGRIKPAPPTGARCCPFSLVLLWMRNPAPPKKPWNDDSNVNSNKRYGFNPGNILWCEMDFATIHSSEVNLNSDSLTRAHAGFLVACHRSACVLAF